MKNILIIENEPALAKTLQNVLEGQEDYATVIAEGGSTGIQLAFEMVPDLILCDIMMEGIDGYKVFQVLKESHFTNHIPFIFITGRSSREDIRAGMNLGADDYIIKPFDNEDLLRSVETQLRKYERIIDNSRKSMIAMLEASPLPGFLYTESGIIKINKAFRNIFGYQEKEIYGKELTELMPLADRDKNKSVFQMIGKGVIKEHQAEVNLFTSRYKILSGIIHCKVISDFCGTNYVLGIFKESPEIMVTPEEIHPKPGDSIAKNLQKARQVKLEAEKRNRHSESEPVKLAENKDIAENELFSARELEVLSMAARGLSTKEIADKLFISDRTVEKHRANMMAKINAGNIVEVIIYAVKNNLICV